MAKLLAVFVAVFGLTFGAPVEEPAAEDSHDLLNESNIGLAKMANILMFPHISDNLDKKLDQFSAISELKSSEGVSVPSLPSFTWPDIKENHLSLPSLPSLHVETEHSLTAPDINLKTSVGQSGLSVVSRGGAHASHLLEVSKDSLIGAAKLPLEVSAEAQAIGGAIPAAAAIKGSAISSAIATPIIVKAVALPGLAAAKTASLMAVPHLILQNIQSVPQLVSNRLKESFGSIGNLKIGGQSGHLGNSLAQLVVIEDSDKLENEGSIAFEKDTQKLQNAVGVLKAGALGLKAGAIGLKAKTVGLATKGLLVAKKGVYTAGRIIMKPIAIIAGAHLKALGTGLTLTGKLIGGTGAKVAKTGTAIKYAGLGGIGMGASAVAWGFDKSAIVSHFSTRVETSTDDLHNENE